MSTRPSPSHSATAASPATAATTPTARVVVPDISIDIEGLKLEGVLSPCTPAPAATTTNTIRRAPLEIPTNPRKRARSTFNNNCAHRPAFLRFTPDALLSNNDPLTPPMCAKAVEPQPTPDAPRKLHLPPSPVGLAAASFGADSPPVARRLLFE